MTELDIAKAKEVLVEFVEENASDLLTETAILCDIFTSYADINSGSFQEQFEQVLSGKDMESLFMNSEVAVASLDRLVELWPSVRHIIVRGDSGGV